MRQDRGGCGHRHVGELLPPGGIRDAANESASFVLMREAETFGVGEAAVKEALWYPDGAAVRHRSHQRHEAESGSSHDFGSCGAVAVSRGTPVGVPFAMWLSFEAPR